MDLHSKFRNSWNGVWIKHWTLKAELHLHIWKSCSPVLLRYVVTYQVWIYGNLDLSSKLNTIPRTYKPQRKKQRQKDECGTSIDIHCKMHVQWMVSQFYPGEQRLKESTCFYVFAYYDSFDPQERLLDEYNCNLVSIPLWKFICFNWI